MNTTKGHLSEVELEALSTFSCWWKDIKHAFAHLPKDLQVQARKQARGVYFAAFTSGAHYMAEIMMKANLDSIEEDMDKLHNILHPTDKEE